METMRKTIHGEDSIHIVTAAEQAGAGLLRKVRK